MLVLGLSPLDKDSTVSLVADGRVLYAAGEERFSRTKQQSGFPHRALKDACSFTGVQPQDIDLVAYPFLSWQEEVDLENAACDREAKRNRGFRRKGLQAQLRSREERIRQRDHDIPGLPNPNEMMRKGALKSAFYRLAGGTPEGSLWASRWAERQARAYTKRGHYQWHHELERFLGDLGLKDKLKRFEHHQSHAANAYLASGQDRALILTIDAYGSGLAASVSIGEGGRIRRLKNIPYPNSLGVFYETVTSSLGFKPSRHEGKIVGLAAYGDPTLLTDVVLDGFIQEDGEFRAPECLNVYFSRHLASRFPKIDVAAAYQTALETIVCHLARYWVRKTNCSSVVLSGGVAANVKMNQRIYEVEGVQRIFVYPNMGDGGCGTGLGLLASQPEGTVPAPITDVYLGPEYTAAEIRKELELAGVPYSSPGNIAQEVAQAIHSGRVVARFDGRMEYGPRALGNRSILYHAIDPEVNQWLNNRLGRTEFMPFAPVTLWEARHQCYENISGAEHAAQFMTVTLDCTDTMKRDSPAAIHVDGTARPQLVREDVNPGYYHILKEYEKLSGIPTLINTSFNMHEEPIVCTPADAVKAFLQGNLDVLAIGPYMATNPKLRADHVPEAAAVGVKG